MESCRYGRDQLLLLQSSMELPSPPRWDTRHLLFLCTATGATWGMRAEAGGFSRHGQWPAEACRRVGDAQMDVMVDLYRSKKTVATFIVHG